MTIELKIAFKNASINLNVIDQPALRAADKFERYEICAAACNTLRAALIELRDDAPVLNVTQLDAWIAKVKDLFRTREAWRQYGNQLATELSIEGDDWEVGSKVIDAVREAQDYWGESDLNDGTGGTFYLVRKTTRTVRNWAVSETSSRPKYKEVVTHEFAVRDKEFGGLTFDGGNSRRWGNKADWKTVKGAVKAARTGFTKNGNEWRQPDEVEIWFDPYGRLFRKDSEGNSYPRDDQNLVGLRHVGTIRKLTKLV